MTQLRRINHLLILFLLSGIIWLTLNSSINIHSHKLPSGEIIHHAHPYTPGETNAPFESHHHTQIEYLLIGQLTFFLIAFSLLSLTVIYFKRYNGEKHITYRVYPISSNYLTAFHTRGPPPPVS